VLEIRDVTRRQPPGAVVDVCSRYDANHNGSALGLCCKTTVSSQYILSSPDGLVTMMYDNPHRLDHRQQITSDIDNSRNAVSQQEAFARELLSNFGQVLNQADEALEDLQGKEDMVGSAIVRKCQELADATGQLATELERQNIDDRRRLAQACLEDARSISHYGNNGLLPRRNLQEKQQQEQQSFAMMEPTSEEDMMAAVAVAASFLRDVESAFRSIERQEADEIGDAALALARLFITSLQSFHETLTPEEVVAAASRESHIHPSSSRRIVSGVTIEELEAQEEEGGLSNAIDISDKDIYTQSKPLKLRQRRASHRQRVLWPAIGPAVSDALEWGRQSAIRSPILAVALGLTLWPCGIVAALVGGPIVVADGVIQHFYSHFQNGPIIEGLEQGAGQMLQASKLSLVCSRIVAKQALRVVSRQVDHHGGIGKIAQNVGCAVVHHSLHPIQTVGMAWNGLAWTFGLISDTAQNILDQNFNQERRASLELQ
jgi:hypothetical protein